jgi:hypothetical protein
MRSNIMKFAKSISTGTGAVVLAGLIFSLIAPKTARGVASALVQVTNTASNPVPNLDTERNGRILYESAPTVTGCGAQTCTFLFAVVPAGYRLHAQNISAVLLATGGSGTPFTAVLGDLTPANQTINSMGLNGVIGPVIQGTATATLNQPITAYFPAGDQPIAYANLANLHPSDTQQFVLTGYLENCAITGCPN